MDNQETKGNGSNEGGFLIKFGEIQYIRVPRALKEDYRSEILAEGESAMCREAILLGLEVAKQKRERLYP